MIETVSPLEDPNKSYCPIDSARLDSLALSTASMWTLSKPFRECSRESKAPALISASITLLLHTAGSTFFKKSKKSLNLSFFCLELIRASTTFSPTFLIADKPKRISFPTGANSLKDSLTSGGNTLIPMRRHSFK